MNTTKVNLQRGQAMMVATIFFLVISATIIFGLVGPIVRQQKMASQLLLSRQSYFLAEAGIEDVVYRILTGETVDMTEVLSMGGNSVTTVTTNNADDSKEVVSIGAVNEQVRKVRTRLTLGNGVLFNYGIQVGNGGFVLSNNAGVNGSVYANAGITGSNGTFITGSAISVTSINGVTVGTGTTGDAQAPQVSNAIVRGSLYCQSGSGNNKACNTTFTPAEVQPFPITEDDINGWKADAEAGGVFVGNKNLTGTNNILGPIKIQGDLNVGINAKLTLTGTLWVTGNITLSNGAEIALDSSYGAGDGLIVVDGISLFSNGSIFSGSGNDKSYTMILSTNTTNSAITLNNNVSAAIIYAPYGTVQLNNNATLKQVSAKTLSISNNAVLNYIQGMINAGFVNGPTGGYEIMSWKEIE